MQLNPVHIFRGDVVEGIFKPTWCSQTGDCALALATFDSKCCYLVRIHLAFIHFWYSEGSTELNNTTKIVEHIKKEHFFVCVLFVGSNLNIALDILQTGKEEHIGSPLIIHYHPSYATVHHNLSQVCIIFNLYIKLSFKFKVLKVF